MGGFVGKRLVPFWDCLKSKESINDSYVQNIKGSVYMHTNKNNGKMYIDLTTKSVHKRFMKHLSDARNGRGCIKFSNAINKYGEDCWITKILINDLPKSELGDWERILIAYHNSITLGYNITAGGEGLFGLKHTKETKEKLKKAHTGKILSKETKEKLRKANLGKKQSQEIIDKKINSLKKYKSINKTYRSITVVSPKGDVIVSKTSMKEFCDSLGINIGTVEKKLSGTRNGPTIHQGKFKGYSFYYTDKYPGRVAS